MVARRRQVRRAPARRVPARRAPPRQIVVKEAPMVPKEVTRYAKKTASTGLGMTGRALMRGALGVAGAGIGSLLGPLGTKVGGVLGMMGGNLVDKVAPYAIPFFERIGEITGLGDYAISADVNQNTLLSGRPPKVVNKAHRGETVISNQEFLTDIYTSNTAGNFQIQGYPLNPGLLNSFPLLAAIAANYEEYRFEGLAYEFRSMSADALNSTNTALGSVMMATQYNSVLPAFASKAEMENYEGGVSCKPSKNILHFVECEPAQNVLNELYVRSGSVPSGQDQRFYDLGTMYIATTGFQGANVNIGELWVTYQVGLLKLKMFVSLGNFNSYWRQVNSAYNATTGLLGTGTVTPGYQNMVCSVAVVGGSAGLATYTNGLYFPSSSIKQSYKVTLIWAGAGSSAVRFPSYITVGCFNGAGLAEGTPSVAYDYATPAVGDTAFAMSCALTITTDGLTGVRGFGGTSGGSIAGAYIAFQNSTTVLPTAGNEMEIIVQQVPNAGLAIAW
nr:putative capsid protein [Crucivirus sp.]